VTPNAGVVNPPTNDHAEYRVAQHLSRDKYIDPDLSVEATPIRWGLQDQSSLTPLILDPKKEGLWDLVLGFVAFRQISIARDRS
jgi:hypothetical protein